MKHLILLIALLLSLTSFGFAQIKDDKVNGKSINREVAAEGSTVWVIVNPVKPDKREQFEKFVFEVFWSNGQKLSSAEQKTFKQTRVLIPTAPNKDGNYDYLFIMDPLVPSVDYSIENTLKKMHGEEKASQYYKMFMDSLAGPQVGYVARQSRF